MPILRAMKGLSVLGLAILMLGPPLLESAGAKSSPIQNQHSIAIDIEVLFQRWFFLDWLGELLVIDSAISCPQTQVEEAVRNKAAFPTSLETIGNEKDASRYCRPTATRFNDRER
jgi:hypothetical protein